MMERTAATSAALADELRVVVQQVEELIHAIGDDRDDALKAARDRVSGAVASARHRLADADRRTRRRARRVQSAVSTYARQNPWTALSMGAAAGLILGAIFVPGPWRSRRRERRSQE